MQASTKLTLDDGALSLTDMVAQLGGNRLSGHLSAQFSDIPYVSGALNVGMPSVWRPFVGSNTSLAVRYPIEERR